MLRALEPLDSISDARGRPESRRKRRLSVLMLSFGGAHVAGVAARERSIAHTHGRPRRPQARARTRPDPLTACSARQPSQ